MVKSKKIAVVLAGCGVYDGAEIHEATLTLLAIAKAGAAYEIFAPDTNQHHVVNHLTGEVMNETRNVLVESARIARGAVKNLKEYQPAAFDGIIFPGGFGVAKNLCTFAIDGANCSVNAEVVRAVKATAEARKPIGALCIAPALVTAILGPVEVTIGDDAGTAEAIESLGGKHVPATHGEVVIDHTYKVVTSPCYMLDATIEQIETGTRNVVKTILSMV